MTEEKGTPATRSIQVKEFLFRTEGGGGCLGDKTKGSSHGRGKNTACFHLCVWMERVEMGWLGKGRVAVASAPLVHRAVH